MIHLIYEGERVQKLIALIREEEFFITDREHARKIPQDFLHVFDDAESIPRLDELARGEAVYLSDNLRKNLRRELYPSLRFQRRMHCPERFPKRLALMGEWKRILSFVDFLLKYHDFCIGFVAEDWQKKDLTERSLRLRPFREQPLCLDFTGQSFWQIFFEDGHPGNLDRWLKKEAGKKLLVTRKRIQSLPAESRIFCPPRIGGWRTLWEFLLSWYAEEKTEGEEEGTFVVE